MRSASSPSRAVEAGGRSPRAAARKAISSARYAASKRSRYPLHGSAATLEQVVDFYDRRFIIGLTPQEKADLVAFLKAL